MANLHVQPKRKNYLWVWILIILIIVAAVYYYYNYYSKGIKPGTANASLMVPAASLHFTNLQALEPDLAAIVA